MATILLAQFRDLLIIVMPARKIGFLITINGTLAPISPDTFGRG